MSIFNYFKPKQIAPSENSEIADLLGPSVLNEANESVLKIIGSPTKVRIRQKHRHQLREENILLIHRKIVPTLENIVLSMDMHQR